MVDGLVGVPSVNTDSFRFANSLRWNTPISKPSMPLTQKQNGTEDSK